MNAEQQQAWERAAGEMVERLGADRRNARMLADPWSRAAHSIVQGWRIRLSRPPANERTRTLPRPTWEAWARLERELLARRVTRATCTPWRRWASARVVPPRRYVRKCKRRW